MSEAFDLDKSFKRDGRRYYPLLLRADQGRADDVVVDINPVAMRGVSGAASNMFRGGGAVAAMLATLVFSIFMSRMGWLLGGAHVPMFALFVVWGFSFVSFLTSFFILFFLIKKDVVSPFIINKRNGLVIQMLGSNRMEVSWLDLEPYIEIIHLVHPAGGARFFRLHLVSQENGEKIIITASGGLMSEWQVAESYRFLSDYMCGAWDSLPEEIETLGRVTPSFWKRVRLSATVSAPDLNDPLWKKLLFGVLAILSLALKWPFEVPDMVSSLIMKAPPEFSQADLDAAYWDGSNPPMPEALAKRIKSMEPDRLEKAVYGTGLVIGALIWVPFLIWLTWKLGTFEF